ncbi:C4-dicarboxylate transporter DctA [Bacillus pseudomycoides]|jgi:Na+/H+-dicarboxylate symporter|nr:C4-dicarboxylate transporter DctA [Bacillus pseudomycoides]
MSETRAIINLIGNGIATVVVAKSENEFNEGKDKQMLIGMQKEKIAG